MADLYSPRSKLSPRPGKSHYLWNSKKGPHYRNIYLFKDNRSLFRGTKDNGQKAHGYLRLGLLIPRTPLSTCFPGRERWEQPKEDSGESILTKRGQSLHHQSLVDIQKVSKHNISHLLFFRKLDSMLTKADQAQGHASGYKATVLWTTPDRTIDGLCHLKRETIKRRGAAAWANF